MEIKWKQEKRCLPKSRTVFWELKTDFSALPVDVKVQTDNVGGLKSISASYLVRGVPLCVGVVTQIRSSVFLVSTRGRCSQSKKGTDWTAFSFNNNTF